MITKTAVSVSEARDIIVGFLRAEPGSPVSKIFLGTVLNETAVRKNIKALEGLGVLRRESGHRHREDLWWVVEEAVAQDAATEKEG